MFRHAVHVVDASGAAIDSVEAWVDTASTYTWLPRRLFLAAGVEPDERRQFVLANGAREEREVAQVRLSLGGRPFYTYCAVSGEGEELLLGAVALEEAGLAVDPVNRRLVPADGYALTAVLAD